MLSVPAGGDSVSHQVDHRVTKDPSQPTNRPNPQTGLGRAASHATATTVDTSCHTDQKDARQKVKPAQPAEKSGTASVCRSSQQHTSHRVPQRASHYTSQHTSRTNIVTTDCEPVEIQQDHYVFSNSSGSSSTIPTRHVTLQGEPVEMIIDTGASVNILQSSTYNSLQDRPTLQPTSTRIFPYGEKSPLPV